VPAPRPDALNLVLSEESSCVANHSVRSWVFARLLAEHLNVANEVDDSLLFAATILHDIGLRRGARAPIRFEVDGADQAANFLTAQGISAVDVDKVWEAIALHTSPGIPERRGPLTFLVRAGAGVDFGYFTDYLSDAQAADIHQAYPRLGFPRGIVDDIVEQCREVPERGPQFSIGGELTRQRSTPPYLTQLEVDSAGSRWGA
jgi:HD domain